MKTFSDKIDEYVKNKAIESDKHHVKKNDQFNSSEAGYCPRKIYLDRVDPIKEPEATLRIFQMGNIIHEFIQKEVITGGVYEKDHIIHTGLGFCIKAKPDIIIDDQVIELKSTKSISYINTPNANHVKQVNLYLKALGLKFGKIIYISNSDLESKEFNIIYSEDLYNEVVSDFAYVFDCIKQNIPYLKVEPYPNPYCYTCKYYKKCYPRRTTK